MDILDTLDTLKDRAADLAQAGVAQSKRLAEIAKLKMANLSEEDTMKKAYLEIGRLYYAEHAAAPDGAYADACERITAARAAIETNNDRIAQLKASGDSEDGEPAAQEAQAQEVSAQEYAEEDTAGEKQDSQE